MNPSICVIGSANTDMVIKADRLPAPGETVLGGTFLMNAGGKGANQAVAAARLGRSVGVRIIFVACLGNDLFGQQAIGQFQQEGIEVDYIATHPDEPSGVALIGVDSHGENSILVASGANVHVTPEQVRKALAELPAETIVLLQLEIPLPTVTEAIKVAAQRGMRVLLNPAPAQPIDPSLLASLYVITPNETEAELLTGIQVTDEVTARQAAQRLHEAGVPNVVITMGAKGAWLSTAEMTGFITVPPVQAVDTTAAGDCFNGALAVALAENKALPDAVRFACRAASISVTRMGAQTSMPDRSEL